MYKGLAQKRVPCETVKKVHEDMGKVFKALRIKEEKYFNTAITLNGVTAMDILDQSINDRVQRVVQGGFNNITSILLDGKVILKMVVEHKHEENNLTTTLTPTFYVDGKEVNYEEV